MLWNYDYENILNTWIHDNYPFKKISLYRKKNIKFLYTYKQS